MGKPATFDLTHMRLRDDDNDEANATWLFDLDTNGSIGVDTNFRIRAHVLEDNGGSENNVTVVWYVQLNAGGYNPVSTGSSVVKAVTSTHFADGDDCTQQLAADSFNANNDGMSEDGNAGGANLDITANQAFETELCCQIVSGDVVNGDHIYLKPTNNGTPFKTETVILEITVVEGGTADLRQGVWRWYDDATPDTSMTALANENVAPTLTTAQMQNGIVRLRVQLAEIGGGAASGIAINVQYSEDGTHWNYIADRPPTSGEEGFWFRWADGAATSGNTIDTQLLTGTDASGKYHEGSGATEDVSANATHEIDIAILDHWPPPDTTVRIRLLNGGTPLPLDSGATEIQLQTSTAADRTVTITRMAPHTDGSKALEIRFAPWHRLFYDGTNWWFFTLQPDDPGNIAYYYWTGSGGWSSKATVSISGTPIGALHSPAFKVIAGTPVVFIVTRASSSTRYWRRGEISGTTITWDTEGSQALASDRHVHASIDDGDYWWIGGITAATGVWAARATNADAGSSWTPGFNTAKTLADANVASGNVFSIIGLGSDKALCIWHNETDGDLNWAIVTDASGFGTKNTIHANCHKEDWGHVRSGGYVYVMHTDGIADDSPRRLSVFSESGESFASGPSPGDGGVGNTGSSDGLPMCANGDDIYYFGMFQGPEGGQDRNVKYRLYSGPGSGGSWGDLTEITPTGLSRGNMDYLGCADQAGGSNVIAYTLLGDDVMLGTSYAVEYHTLSVSAGGVAVTPAACDAQAAIIAPTPILGSLSLTPALADAQAAVIAPTVVQSSLAIAPAPADAQAAVVALTVQLGSQAVTPAPANAQASLIPPAVIQGSQVVAPAPADATASVIDPTVSAPSGVEVTPAPCDAQAAALVGAIIQGSLSLTPTPCDAQAAVPTPTALLGNTVASPAPCETQATVQPPVVVAGSLVVVPAPTDALAAVPGVTVVLGPTSASPAACDALASVSNPGVQSGGDVGVTPAPADATASVIDPTAVLGSQSVSPTICEAQASVAAPTVLLGSTSVAPVPCDATASVIDPSVGGGGDVISPAPCDVSASIQSVTAIQGNTASSPVPADAVAAMVAPSPILGSLVVTVAACEALALVIDPIVDIGTGDVVVSPAPCDASSSVVAPIVQYGSLVVSPAYADVSASVVAPSIEYGSTVSSQAPCEAQAEIAGPDVVLGPLSVTPDPCQATASLTVPAIVLGPTSASPAVCEALAAVVAPTLHFTSTIASPAFCEALASVSEPVVITASVDQAGTVTLWVTMGTIDLDVQRGTIDMEVAVT